MPGGALIRRLWKALPSSLRRSFWLSVGAIRRATLPFRVALVWRRGHPAGGVAEGVAIVGLMRDSRGVAQAARLFADGLERSEVDVLRLDAGPALRLAPIVSAVHPGRASQPTTLVSCLNPPELLRWLDANGGRDLKGRRHVGYWAWELPEAPAAWRAALRFVDEVWCHSDFAAEAIRRLAEGDVPVRTLPLPVFAIGAPRSDRARFDLPLRACVVLAAMDLRSSAARKNPLGALEAYLRARPEPDDDAVLVCKISGLDAQTHTATVLRQAAERRPDVRLLTELLSDADMRALTASSDIVLFASPSRGLWPHGRRSRVVQQGGGHDRLVRSDRVPGAERSGAGQLDACARQ